MPNPSLETARELRPNGRMMAMIAGRATDPHGYAALLLVESLLHALVDKAVISRGEVIDIIDIAAEVEEAVTGTLDGAGSTDASLLAPLAKTFRIDGG